MSSVRLRDQVFAVQRLHDLGGAEDGAELLLLARFGVRLPDVVSGSLLIRPLPLLTRRDRHQVERLLADVKPAVGAPRTPPARSGSARWSL
jgi:hypothetical protein